MRDLPPPPPRPARRSHFMAILCTVVIANVVMLGAGWAVLVTLTSHAQLNDYPAHHACARTLPDGYVAGSWRFDGPNTIRSKFRWTGDGAAPHEFGDDPEVRCTFRLADGKREDTPDGVELTSSEVIR